MAKPLFSVQFESLSRRRFFRWMAGTAACAAAVAVPVAGAAEVVRIGPRERATSDIEAWNVGFISASRPNLTPAENENRTAELRAEIAGRNFGHLNVRGRWIGISGAEPVEEHAFLLFGNPDDSGNLKGFLRKIGRQFEQEAVVWKGYYSDALLFALKDLPALELKDGETKNLGRFHPSRIAQFHAMLRAREVGHWEDLGIWTTPSFFSRVPRRVLFDEDGNLAA
jgi:hypothetical protein